MKNVFFQDNYTFAQPGIQNKVKALEELVSRIDGKCVQHKALGPIQTKSGALSKNASSPIHSNMISVVGRVAFALIEKCSSLQQKKLK